MTLKEAIRHALISILVGAIIAFITTFLQGVLGYLQHVQLEPTGTVVGVITYLVRNLKHT